MKFTIRDLFLVTLVAAVSLGWYVDHRLSAARYAENESRWQALFDDAMSNLSVRSPAERFYDTPAGWSDTKLP
jgi:hypothetical protein